MKKFVAAVTISAILLVSPTLLAKRKFGDVENIGNRKINGRILKIFPNFVSLKKELEIGAYYSQLFEKSARLVEDLVVTQYVSDLVLRLVRSSDAKVPFRVKVIDTDEVNAFALPGGFLYVNRGLILKAETEAELAGVLAHEIAHVTARHATERMTKAQLLQFASLPALLIGGGYWAQQGIYTAMGLGMNLTVLGISRGGETEADLLGTQYLWNAGFDPEGFVNFFERLHADEKVSPGKFAGFWRTHPSKEDRLDTVSEEIGFLPIKDEAIVSTSDFDRVQKRLKQIEDRPLPKPKGAKKKPTLKRRTNDPAPTRDEDQPTLKRPTLTKPGE